MRTWILPEHIEDLLPADAKKLERLRRAALDLFASHGYELVMPPLLEYVESLLSGTGQDIDLATFKLVDQLTGRTMGIRADTTPQVARIDAHLLNRQGVTRLCYAGSVLHTLPAGLGKSRQPFQAGAEMYGHAGLEADMEIQQLMVDALHAFGVKDLHLDIGHPAIFRSLIAAADVPADIAEQAFMATENKDLPALKSLEASLGAAFQPIAALSTLYGDAAVLARAGEILPGTPAITAALAQLRKIENHFSQQGLTVTVDLGELGGFNYESGITFAAYAPGAADALARGGRYDEVGKAFGRARAATGFSMDLKALLPLVADTLARGAILAPLVLDDFARAEIARLRAAGEVVISALPGQESYLYELDCDRRLSVVDGCWTAVPLSLTT